MSMSDIILHKELAYKIVGIAMQVHNEPGHGFLEKVYENAMMVIFRKDGVPALQQYPIAVKFLGEVVGDYIADFLVDAKVIVELKSIESIKDMQICTERRQLIIWQLRALNRQLS